jgi:hypothetical protein
MGEDVKDELKPGTRVKMSDSLKAALKGKCGRAGRHVGPFDPEDKASCFGCSSAHVEEFGGCVGVVRGPADMGGPEVDVTWLPSKLVYAYDPAYLVRV